MLIFDESDHDMFAHLCGLGLLLFVFHVLAVFDPNRPRTAENFDPIDPAEGNPDHQITCFGHRPEILLPVYSDWDPNSHTVQQLCAKPQYGGLAPEKQLGGYCAVSAASPYEGPGRGLVAFDRSRAARSSLVLFNPQLLLYCRTRCFCTSDLVDGMQPEHYPDWDEAAFGPGRLGREDQTYQIKVEESQTWGTMQSHRGRTNHRVFRTGIWILPETAWQVTRPQIWQVSISRENYPICSGPLPQFPLPGSFSGSDFGNLQSFCAVQLAGGNS